MKAPKKARPDMDGLIGRFSDALAFIEVATISLDAAECRAGAELVVLEQGFRDLKKVYTELERMAGAAAD